MWRVALGELRRFRSSTSKVLYNACLTCCKTVGVSKSTLITESCGNPDAIDADSYSQSPYAYNPPIPTPFIYCLIRLPLTGYKLYEQCGCLGALPIWRLALRIVDSALYTIAHTSSQTANPPEARCLGSPAATKLPLNSRVRPWAVDWPGATRLTLWPSDFMKATVALSYAYSKLTRLG